MDVTERLFAQPQPSPQPQLLGGDGDGRDRDERDELDPELLSLPDPPRSGRTLTVAVLVLAAVSALAMTFALRRDVAYALAPLLGHEGVAADVGDLRLASPELLNANENRFVRGDAMLGAAGGIRYERPLVADSFRTLPVAGRGDLWVDLRVPAGQENGRWEPPRTFAGRLVRFGDAGPRHRGIAGAIAGVTHERVPASAWLMVDGEEPASSRWVLALAAALLAFAVWNVLSALRLVRKLS
jgi:hypothetical protein